MTSRLCRLFFAALLLSLVASACGTFGSDTGDRAEPSDPAVVEPTVAVPPTTEPVDAATSIPVPEDDAAAEDAIAGLDDTPAEPSDPTSTAQGYVRTRFNIDPTEEQLSCFVAAGEQDEVLAAALQSPEVAAGQIDDTQLRALSYTMNNCLDTRSLADWAIQAVGPRGEVAQTGPPCLQERFDDGDAGDLTFFNFVALVYQFRLDPSGVDGLVSSLADCAPITSLTDFFAEQSEQTGRGPVDRDCLNDALSDRSQEFWQVFVDGGQPPVEFITPFIDECPGTPAPQPTPRSDLAASIPADFVAWSGTGALADVNPEARANAYSAPPPMSIDPAKSYEAVLATGGGEIRIRLLSDTAPITVNNFVNLARDGFYDGTIFHRVLADFMAQGGDPTGTGTGGPGYQFQDEFEGGPALDRKGLLAMANSGPATNGSQFFITFVPTEWLTGNHTVFGEVVEGIEIVDSIQLRDPAPGAPGQVLESVTIVES